MAEEEELLQQERQKLEQERKNLEAAKAADSNTGKTIYCVSSDGTLNIRSTPSSKGALVGTMFTGGAGAVVVGKSGGWYKVNYQGVVGYVNGNYVSFTPGAAPKPVVSNRNRTVYYVVMGSFTTLEEGRSTAFNYPDGFDQGSFYKTKVNGQTYYRYVISEYYSKADARREVDNFPYYDLWIWTSPTEQTPVYIMPQYGD